MSDNIGNSTPIAFADIRKGDIIRAVSSANGVTRTYEGEAYIYDWCDDGADWATKEGDYIATSNEHLAATAFRTPRGIGLPTYYLVHRAPKPLPTLPGTVIKVTASRWPSYVGAAFVLDNEGDLSGVLSNGTWAVLSAEDEQTALIEDYEVLYAPEVGND